MKRFLFIALLLIINKMCFSDEGMWIPLLLEKYNIETMKQKGFKLSAEDIYSINKASMKDAVMIFGRGCTAELISGEGLLITNHHCGFDAIQTHSTMQNDYLTNGFWAKTKAEELVNPGLTVTFLIRMEDVTVQVFEGVSDTLTDDLKEKQIDKNISSIEKKAIEGTHYKAIVKPFYNGNEYYLFVNEVFEDVRLVGAPPAGIGKFGGDTDNWEWPRHTGDFSIFRIYANKENQPAVYSIDNVPYKPKRFFPISLKGVKQNDFTMVFGYPGRTSEYLPSYAVKLIAEIENPNKIKIRQTKMEIIGKDMESDPAIRLKYASKYYSISNSWKKWLGESKGIEGSQVVQKKQELESRFKKWIQEDSIRIKKYNDILPEYESLYHQLGSFEKALNYVSEAGFSMDLMTYASSFFSLINISKKNTNDEELQKKVQGLINYTRKFYKDFNIETEKKVMVSLFRLYADSMNENFQPGIFSRVVKEKHNGDFLKYVNELFEKSMLTDSIKIIKFLKKYDTKKSDKLEQDPVIELYTSVANVYYSKIIGEYLNIDNQIEKLNKRYIMALQDFKKDKVFYPDANSTLRVAFGKVDTYEPRDGVKYNYFTTLKGMMEKDNPNVYDYHVPEKLKELYAAKDFGPYGENGEMHVCFIASNHTTGGNSGSPVLNAEGQLIGVNFDRNWEGTMSDIMYDPDKCRNISLDIRYALFIIDKFAGATHLIKEMDIVGN